MTIAAENPTINYTPDFGESGHYCLCEAILMPLMQSGCSRIPQRRNFAFTCIMQMSPISSGREMGVCGCEY